MLSTANECKREKCEDISDFLIYIKKWIFCSLIACILPSQCSSAQLDCMKRINYTQNTRNEKCLRPEYLECYLIHLQKKTRNNNKKVINSWYKYVDYKHNNDFGCVYIHLYAFHVPSSCWCEKEQSLQKNPQLNTTIILHSLVLTVQSAV